MQIIINPEFWLLAFAVLPFHTILIIHKQHQSIMQTSLFGLTHPGQNIEIPFSFIASNRLSPQLYTTWDSIENNAQKIIYQATLYNEKELAHKLNCNENTGELIQLLYNTLGTDGFKWLSGKFSIVIIHDEEVTLVRDRHGESSMIYYTNKFFSDSYHDIIQHGIEQVNPDLMALKTFLQIGYIPEPYTGVSGLFKVGAGRVIKISSHETAISTLFDEQDFVSESTLQISFKEAQQEYSRLLQKSILKRISGCDRVGVLLSGGYDSGGNIAMLRQVYDGPVEAVSVGFKQNALSEVPYAEMMAKQYNAQFDAFLMDGSEINALPQIITTMGDPFSEAGFMLNYAAMQTISSKKLPVVLGGDGNDQLFGTAAKELALHDKIRGLGLHFMQNGLAAISQNKFFESDALPFRIRFHNEKVRNIMQPDAFGLNDYLMKKLLHFPELPKHPALRDIPVDYKDFNHFYQLHNYHLDIQHAVNEVILFKASRLSESMNVPLVFPYMDQEIYHFVKQLPLRYKVKGTKNEMASGKGVTKYLHKSIIKPLLPVEVTGRKKQGGFSPLALFFSDETLRKNIERYILQSAFFIRYGNLAGIQNFFNEYTRLRQGKGYWFWFQQVKSNQLMNLLQMALWWDITVESKITANSSLHDIID